MPEMKQVTWVTRGVTLVNTDDDDVAVNQVLDLISDRPWGDETGLCLATREDLGIVRVEDAAMREDEEEDAAMREDEEEKCHSDQEA